MNGQSAQIGPPASTGSHPLLQSPQPSEATRSRCEPAHAHLVQAFWNLQEPRAPLCIVDVELANDVVCLVRLYDIHIRLRSWKRLTRSRHLLVHVPDPPCPEDSYSNGPYRDVLADIGLHSRHVQLGQLPYAEPERQGLDGGGEQAVCSGEARGGTINRPPAPSSGVTGRFAGSCMLSTGNQARWIVPCGMEQPRLSLDGGASAAGLSLTSHSSGPLRSSECS